jgi:hypothetical protein
MRGAAVAEWWQRQGLERRERTMIREQPGSEEMARGARALYDQSIRARVETAENIGKMVIIDLETGDYEIDDTGIEAARRLQAKHPEASLYGIRIGYNVAASLGGVMERTAP